MAIVIEKRVSLSFLGDKYESSYITFKSISIKEYEGLQVQAKEIEKDQEKALPFIIGQLKDRFIEGNIDNQKITVEDLEDLPADVILECFKSIQGQLDPKV